MFFAALVIKRWSLRPSHVYFEHPFPLLWPIKCSRRDVVPVPGLAASSLVLLGHTCRVGVLRLDCWMVRDHFWGKRTEISPSWRARSAPSWMSCTSDPPPELPAEEEPPSWTQPIPRILEKNVILSLLSFIAVCYRAINNWNRYLKNQASFSPSFLILCFLRPFSNVSRAWLRSPHKRVMFPSAYASSSTWTIFTPCCFQPVTFLKLSHLPLLSSFPKAPMTQWHVTSLGPL